MRYYPTFHENVECFRIATSVAYVFKVSIDEMKSKTRQKRIVEARQYYFYVCKESSTLTYGKIAGYIKRDHATGVYGAKKIKEQLAIYPDVQEKIDEIYSYLVRKGDEKLSVSLLHLEKALHLYNKFLRQ